MSIKIWDNTIKSHFNMLCIGDSKLSSEILTLCFRDIINVRNDFIMIVTDREEYWNCEIERLQCMASCVIVNHFSDPRFLSLHTLARNGDIKILLITDKSIDGLYSDPRARHVIANNKNYDVTSIIMTDSLATLPVNIRSTIDYVLLVEWCYVSINEYYDDYFKFESKDYLRRMHDLSVIDDFSAMFIDVKSPDNSNKLFLISIL